MTLNHNDIPLDEDMDDFQKLPNSEVSKFKELLMDQALYDTGMRPMVPNSTSDPFKLHLFIYQLFFLFFLFFNLIHLTSY